jgi:hypothetical protein
MIGSDYIANSIWILVLTVLYAEYSVLDTKKSYLISVLLGIGLASRFNFLMILIPLAFYLSVKTGYINAIKNISLVIFTFSMVVLPFLLFDYKNFTPIHYSNFFSRYNNILSYSGFIFPIITLIFSIVLSLRLIRKRSEIYPVISLILLIPVIMIVILDSISGHKASFQLSHYAFTSVLFYGFFVFSKTLESSRNEINKNIMIPK